jgi:hypothetical protein
MRTSDAANTRKIIGLSQSPLISATAPQAPLTDAQLLTFATPYVISGKPSVNRTNRPTRHTSAIAKLFRFKVFAAIAAPRRWSMDTNRGSKSG